MSTVAPKLSVRSDFSLETASTRLSNKTWPIIVYDMTINCGNVATEAHLQLTLNAMGNLLANGDVRGLATYFECPLPVYLNDRFFLFQCRQKIAETLATYVGVLGRLNVRRIEPSLVRIEDSTPYRYLFVARWRFYQSDARCASCNVIRYVGRRGDLDGLMRIELVEYLETGRLHMPAHLFGVDA